MTFSKRRVGFSLILCLVTCPVFAAGGAAVGHLTRVLGDVLVNSAPTKNGAPVAMGDTIETQGGKASLLLGKATVIHLDSNSKLTVTQFVVDTGSVETTTLDLPFGKTRALVRSKGIRKDFKIRSRTAVMGVRGTHVYIDSPKDTSLPQKFVTFDGVADVSVKNSIVGAAPKQVTLTKNEAFNLPAATEGVKQGDLKPVTISEETARALAREVAPPPVEIRTTSDVIKQTVPESVTPTVVDPNLFQGAANGFPIGGLPFDPLADSLVPVTVTVVPHGF